MSDNGELKQRVGFAIRLAEAMEKLNGLIRCESVSDKEAELAEVRLSLLNLQDELHSEHEWLTDRGSKVEIEGKTHNWSLVEFVVGVNRFNEYYEEFEQGVAIWGPSNWQHNRKFESKFRSAVAELRAFTIKAEAIQSNVSFKEARRIVTRRVIDSGRVSKVKKISIPDNRKQLGVDTFNQGKTWRQVTQLLNNTEDPDRDEIDRVSSEIRRFAEKTNQTLEKKSPGRKRESKSDESDV
ncbi:hypothetical protein [Crateriforma conspicua]|uniref:Uncharacterized protein n=1 Tax=Crateriforma conspicua TaxID=2527996 RepID=A0A5C5XZS2_9PLAN|nr:hypothetical protein [Crateriforma conspicua]TWT68394.1 hypothetical protein Pan14r_06390 [Crateriforma conspicua]